MPPLPLAGSSWWGTLHFPKIKGCGDRKCGSLGSSLTALGRKPALAVISSARPAFSGVFLECTQPYFSFMLGVAPRRADAWPRMLLVTAWLW